MLPSLLFLVGLALLLAGGEALIRGATALALRFGVSEVTIGLTVVAFGTSMPELVVSTLAAIRGDAGIAFGNVVGSNIANVTLLLGVTALARPVVVQSVIVAREIPMMVLASAAALVLALDGPFQGAASNSLRRGDGIVLLLLFVVFLYYTGADVLRDRRDDPLLAEAREATPDRGARAGRSLLLIVGGIAGLTIGGSLLVTSASEIARSFGVPDVVIGSTIVAVGTSLPELAASLVAARHGQSDLAIGNLVGSNIFNLLFVLAVAACASPIPVPQGGAIDLGAMLAVAGLVFVVSKTGRRVTRVEGVILAACYVGYLLFQQTRIA